MRGKKRSVAKRSRQPVDVFALVTAWSRTLFQLAAVAFIISLGYILYGIFSGALAQMPNEQMQRVADNLTVMGQIMTAAGFLATVAMVILTAEDIAFTVVMGIIGAGLMFGMPILVASNLQDASSTPAMRINEWSRNAGMAVLLVVGLRIVWEIVGQIKSAGARALAKSDEEQSTVAKVEKKTKSWRSRLRLWDPCWELPYCHEAVREVCPAYKAGKSCWRYGYGCNCDPSLIETLIRTGGASTGKGAERTSSAQRRTEAAYVRSDLAADGAVGAGERTIPCTKCPIFIEHQRQKFRIINPLAIIATIVGLAALYKPLTGIYERVIDVMAQLAARFTLNTEMLNAEEWVGYLNTQTVQIFFFLFVGMIALAYVLKAVEWLVLKRMIL